MPNNFLGNEEIRQKNDEFDSSMKREMKNKLPHVKGRSKLQHRKQKAILELHFK